MSKRQWFLAAGMIVLTGCPPGLRPIFEPSHDLCVPAGFSENENRNDDQIDLVECTKPAPQVQP